MSNLFSGPRALLATALLAPALAVGLAAAPAAHGHGSVCRTDPLVRLSDGTEVTLIAEVAADPTAVQSVTYTLHAPEGVSVVSVEYSGDVSPDLETLVFANDAKDHHFKSETVVEVDGHETDVTATMTAAGHTKHANGHSHKSVKLDVDVH